MKKLTSGFILFIFVLNFNLHAQESNNKENEDVLGAVKMYMDIIIDDHIEKTDELLGECLELTADELDFDQECYDLLDLYCFHKVKRNCQSTNGHLRECKNFFSKVELDLIAKVMQKLNSK